MMIFIALIIILLILVLLFKFVPVLNKWFFIFVCAIYRLTISKDVDYLQEINQKYLDADNIKYFSRILKKGKYKKCKEKLDEYVHFCADCEVRVSENDQELAAQSKVTMALLDPKAALDEALANASEEYKRVCEDFSESGQTLYLSRKESVEIIEKTEELVNSIAKNPKEFNKEIQEITDNKQKFLTAEEFGIKEAEQIKKSAANATIGIGTGVAVATYAPTAAMWVATTFGTASTGTAISALSGAAATNAALAWLGGGALSAGGAGMAAGKALLALAGPVGWGIAGTSTLVALVALWCKHKKLQKNEKEELLRIIKCTETLKETRLSIIKMAEATKAYNMKIRDSLQKCEPLCNGDYSLFSENQKNQIRDLVNHVKNLSKIVCKVVDQEE